jgi:acyl-coenzyme A synthetase/AMP-(fatty) acid ligase/acyl carrier protein
MIENRIYEGLIACGNECPDQVALEELVTGKTYSYGQLLGLIDAGVTFLDSHQFPDTVVVLASADIDSVVALYAIVCSGRTAAVIDDEIDSPHGVILKNKFPELCVNPSSFVSALSKLEQSVSETRDIPTANEVESVLFTSGSTGEPKIFGIPSYRSPEIINQSRTDTNQYAVLNVRRPTSTPYRNGLQRALVNKGRLITVDLSVTSPSEMDRLLTGRVIHESTVTPTMVRRVFPHLKGDWTKSFQYLHLSGERVYQNDLQIIFRALPSVNVRVAYGSTEFGRISSGWISPKDMSSVVDPVSTGAPMKSIEIRDDDSGVVTETGAIGRLFVQGAQGFIGSLSDGGCFSFERFQVDDWQDTGDRGFINDLGELVVLGRTQETVKIRGSRVSILEVENIIRDTGMVSAVMVAVYQDAHGNDALGVLAVVPEGSDFALAELRRHITDRYPLVMCPTRSLVVDQVPVLGTGKVDRVTATRMLNELRPVVATDRTDMTLNTVRDVILKVLPMESLGINEDVFEAGLDSLASLEVLELLSDAFGVMFDVRILLENPTVSSLAEAVGRYVHPDSRLAEISLEATTTTNTKIYWILPGGNPFMAQKLAASITEVRHIAVLNLGCMTDDVVLPDANQMVSCLVEAIISDENEGESVFVAGFSSAGLFASEVARTLLSRHGREAGLILIDPVDHDSLSGRIEGQGQVANPLHLMLGREGRLAKLDPVQMDHALFGLQLYALSRLTMQPVQVPTLHIAKSQSRVQQLLWRQNPKSKHFHLDLPHLDYVRRPQPCASAISAFVQQVTAMNQKS